jgi:hypothetical protein
MESSFLKKISLAFFFLVCFILIVKSIKEFRQNPSSYAVSANGEPNSDGASDASGIHTAFQKLINKTQGDTDRQAKLVEMTQRKMKREIAGSKQQSYRTALSAGKQDVWHQILMTNSSKFYALRKKAASMPGGITPCTLCDGEGYMADCITCSNSDGKCVTCYGTGTLSNGDEICPTCVGTKNCYLCNGFKKMLCPFCDDGMIDVQVPLPPELPPTL